MTESGTNDQQYDQQTYAMHIYMVKLSCKCLSSVRKSFKNTTCQKVQTRITVTVTKYILYSIIINVT